jgi:hypothetical protein
MYMPVLVAFHVGGSALRSSLEMAKSRRFCTAQLTREGNEWWCRALCCYRTTQVHYGLHIVSFWCNAVGDAFCLSYIAPIELHCVVHWLLQGVAEY